MRQGVNSSVRVVLGSLGLVVATASGLLGLIGTVLGVLQSSEGAGMLIQGIYLAVGLPALFFSVIIGVPSYYALRYAGSTDDDALGAFFGRSPTGVPLGVLLAARDTAKRGVLMLFGAGAVAFVVSQVLPGTPTRMLPGAAFTTASVLFALGTVEWIYPQSLHVRKRYVGMIAWCALMWACALSLSLMLFEVVWRGAA